MSPFGKSNPASPVVCRDFRRKNMNWRSIGNLIYLRYKLIWAKMRSRTGRIALFLVGLLSFLLLLALVSAGGVGAAVVAIQSGKAEQVAQILLSGLFLNAVFGSIVLGFGVSAAFTDAELKRYPLNALERFMVRHIVGLAEPFWFLFLAIGSGLVAGLSVFGSYSFTNGTVGLLLLFLCTYLLTRTLSVWIDQLMERNLGYAVLLVLMMLLGVAQVIRQIFQYNRAHLPNILPLLRFTPPFGAAEIMTHGGPERFFGVAVVSGWLVILSAIVTVIEHRRVSWKQTLPAPRSLWDSRLDSIPALFGRRMAPLVGCWLRFYLRNKRFRLLSVLSWPIAAFAVFPIGQPRQGGSIFLGVLGCLPLVTFLGASRIGVNLYGYTAGGLRRLYLFPVDHGATLRAGSYAGLILGAVSIPPAAILWAMLAPRPIDARVIVMPIINAVTALFLFHGLALWTSIYAPRRANYDKIFGTISDASPWGNAVFMGTMMGCMFLPSVLRSAAPWAVDPANWRLTLPAAGFAIIVYFVSLLFVPDAVPGRREAILAIVEGKN
jgi:hypothetical protein